MAWVEIWSLTIDQRASKSTWCTKPYGHLWAPDLIDLVVSWGYSVVLISCKSSSSRDSHPELPGTRSHREGGIAHVFIAISWLELRGPETLRKLKGPAKGQAGTYFDYFKCSEIWSAGSQHCHFSGEMQSSYSPRELRIFNIQTHFRWDHGETISHLQRSNDKFPLALWFSHIFVGFLGCLENSIRMS